MVCHLLFDHIPAIRRGLGGMLFGRLLAALLRSEQPSDAPAHRARRTGDGPANILDRW